MRSQCKQLPPLCWPELNYYWRYSPAQCWELSILVTKSHQFCDQILPAVLFLCVRIVSLPLLYSELNVGFILNLQGSRLKTFLWSPFFCWTTVLLVVMWCCDTLQQTWLVCHFLLAQNLNVNLFFESDKESRISVDYSHFIPFTSPVLCVVARLWIVGMLDK